MNGLDTILANSGKSEVAKPTELSPGINRDMPARLPKQAQMLPVVGAPRTGSRWGIEEPDASSSSSESFGNLAFYCLSQVEA